MASLLSLVSLLLFLALAEGTDGFLVTATNQSQGVEVRVFPDANASKDWPDYKEIEINGYYLPPECGEEFDKCSMLIANASSSNRSQSFMVMFPLVKTLGLLRLTVEGTDFKKDVVTIDLSGLNCNCSPTSFHNIQNRYFIVCPNADLNNIKLVELQLNTTHPTESWLAQDNPLKESVYNLTNSVYVDLPSQSGHVILFAAGYELFYFRTLDGVVSKLDIDLQGNRCFVTSIDYIGEWKMLVYCDNNRAVYVDIESESIFATVDFNKDGQPFVCPNPDVYLAVYTEQHYIQYGKKQVEDFQLSGSNFSNGICCGSQNVTLFAFTDKKRGTQLLNASAGSIRSLSDASCINYPCQPLVMLQNQYLVIREKRGVNWYISVLDSDNNFSLALEAQYTEADLMAIVEGIKQDNVHHSPQDSGGDSGGNSGGDSGGTSIIIPITIVGSIVLILSFLGAIPICIAIVYKKKAFHSIAPHSTVPRHEQRRDLTQQMVSGSSNQGNGAESGSGVEPDTEPLLK